MMTSTTNVNLAHNGSNGTNPVQTSTLLSKEADNGLSNFTQEELLTSELDRVLGLNNDLTAQHEFLKKKYSGLQDELNFALEAQAKLEKHFYKLEAELDLSKRSEADAIRKSRELDQKLSTENNEFEALKAKASEREDELKDQIKNLHSHYQQKMANSGSARPSRLRSKSVNFSPPNFQGAEIEEDLIEPNDRTQASLAHENQVANRTIRHQLKEIGEYKASISQLKEQLGGASAQFERKIDGLKNEIKQLTIANTNLMEDNDSYQLLLQERTLKGQFSLSRFDSTPKFSEPSGFNLGSELSKFDSDDSDDEGVINTIDPLIKQLKDENRLAKDENKALALYINKILSKIMSNPVLADAITNSGDPISIKDTREIQQEKEKASKSAETTKPSAEPVAKPTPSRLMGFFSPSFAPPAPPIAEDIVNSRVSFDLPKPPRPTPAPTRNSTDSIGGEVMNRDDNSTRGSKGSFRSRRSKSMSVSNVNDVLGDAANTSTTMFSFKSAFKRMAVPWKSTSVNPNASPASDSGSNN